MLDLGQKAKKSHEKEEEKIEVELVKEEKEDNSPFLKTVEEDRLERFGTIHETEDDMKSNEAEA